MSLRLYKLTIPIALAAASGLPAQAPRGASGGKSPVPRGDSIVALTSRLINAGGLGEKGEFETSEQFKAKRDALVKSNSRPLLLIKQSDVGEFSYDADSSKMHMKLGAIGRKRNDDDKSMPTFVITDSLISAKSYIGSNAFGVKKKISSTTYNQYEIAMDDDSGYDFPENTASSFKLGTFDPMERDVAMTPARARGLKPYLRFAFYGRLSDGHIVFNSRSTTATITSPYETETRYLTIIFTVEEIRVVDSRTGSLVADATQALNNVE